MFTQLKTQQINVRVETKTEDDVLVQMVLAVECYLLAGEASRAVCKIDDVIGSIEGAIFCAVDNRMRTITLESVFAKKSEVAAAVKAALTPVLQGFGYGMSKGVVTEIRMGGSSARWAERPSMLRGLRPSVPLRESRIPVRDSRAPVRESRNPFRESRTSLDEA